MSKKKIKLRGVRVNNLKEVNLDIPHGQWVAICGRSGSGKSSLAFDTLYAEGQRRYMESLSPYTRQFLDQLDKPDADSIEGIPPAIAVRASRGYTGPRATVGTATEINEFLRQLFASAAEVICRNCRTKVIPQSPDRLAAELKKHSDNLRIQVAFRLYPDPSLLHAIQEHKENGFTKLIVDNKTCAMDANVAADSTVFVIVDRLTTQNDESRIRESLETAFFFGEGCAVVFLSDDQGDITVDGRNWIKSDYYRSPTCSTCGTKYPEPHPRMFSFSNAHGACEKCEGFGSVERLDMDLIVPDASKSLRDGAVAPWNPPSYRHELDELLELAKDYGIPVDVPFEKLSDQQVGLIWDGIEERDFGGLSGFFAWLERRKYKMHVRVFLNRWKSYDPCPECHGQRLNQDARAFEFVGKSLPDLWQMNIRDAFEFFENLSNDKTRRDRAGRVLSEVKNRLRYLCQVGLGYLQLDRQVRTLSTGEAQRVALTSSLGSTLVNMLYVLDEPSAGLHKHDSKHLSQSIYELNQRGNTVIVVDHDPTIIRSAKRIVEVGPEAGKSGGEISFDGNLEELLKEDASLTGEFLSGRADLEAVTRKPRKTKRKLRLKNATGNNLKGINVEIPLNCLCVVTGISGAGKSSLVQQTIYPLLAAAKSQPTSKGLPAEEIIGGELVDEVVLIDASPIGRSARSNPVTYVKAFDDIRKTFAETIDAKTSNFTASHFSFNVDGGRCQNCKGEGHVVVDMQFMADVYVKCTKCRGMRYRNEILAIKYRGKSISDVLNLTVREAFPFFRGQKKVQTKLKALIDVGLDYIRLGQPANTLSTGEAQRLKLAHYLNSSKTKRAIFVLDEPTSGLHMADVQRLVECFDVLIAAGHSMLAVEHNLQLIQQADWIIDLGPGGGEQGGKVVAVGTPEEIMNNNDSLTGLCLRDG